MKLTDLDPRWLSHGGDEYKDKDGNPVPRRERIGITLDCPCGCGERFAVTFANPVDGRGPLQDDRPNWERSGETFETLTLRPSLLRRSACKWHGWISNGEVLSP